MAYIAPPVGTQMPTPPQSPTLGPERVRNPEQEYWLKGTGAWAREQPEATKKGTTKGTNLREKKGSKPKPPDGLHHGQAALHAAQTWPQDDFKMPASGFNENMKALTETELHHDTNTYRNFYAVSSSGRFGAPDAPWGVCNLRYPYVDPQEGPHAVAGQSKAHTWPQPATDK